MPAHVGRLLVLVRWLIGYGNEFAATLRQQAITPHFRLTLQVRFGTADFARILPRIARGLRLAAALEARLVEQAASGRDVPTRADLALLPPRSRGGRHAASGGRRTAPAEIGGDCLDDRLPSAAEIATMLRRKPVGAIIADICRDLGIAPGALSRERWHDLADSIITYGGNFAGLMQDFLFRIHRCAAGSADREAPTLAALEALNRAILVCTGPP